MPREMDSWNAYLKTLNYSFGDSGIGESGELRIYYGLTFILAPDNTLAIHQYKDVLGMTFLSPTKLKARITPEQLQPLLDKILANLDNIRGAIEEYIEPESETELEIAIEKEKKFAEHTESMLRSRFSQDDDNAVIWFYNLKQYGSMPEVWTKMEGFKCASVRMCTSTGTIGWLRVVSGSELPETFTINEIVVRLHHGEYYAMI